MKKELIKFVVLLAVALGSAPAYSALWQWSHTASQNAGADPSINWAEGQSPSSVNDSARAMMARMAEYRDDISGLLTTGGTSTAYTVTTNQGLNATPNDGQQLAITMNATNGAAATLTADGGTAFPIQSSPGNAVASATLILGSPYTMKFSTANSAWMLSGFYASPTNISLGMMMPFTLTTSPNSNFVFPAGQCLSTTTYAAYWAALGSPASGSCSGGQFRIIDMSGRVAAGLDTMPGFSAANRLTSSASGCGTAMTTVGAACTTTESASLGSSNMAAFTPSFSSVSSTFPSTVSGNVPDVIFIGGCCVNIGGSGSGGTPASIGGLALNFSASFNGNGGSSAPFPRLGPTIGVTYLLRVL